MALNSLDGEFEETNRRLRQLLNISAKNLEKQHAVNKVISTQLKEIKEIAVIVLEQLHIRLNAVEERKNKFEARLANVERLLKAS